MIDYIILLIENKKYLMTIQEINPFCIDKYRIPIEREYENWIVSSMDIFFKSQNIPFESIAPSPLKEKQIPADQIIVIDNSIVLGIQFKSPQLSNNKKEIEDQIHWLLNKPEQYNKIASSNSLNESMCNIDIWYCLPYFLNRKCRFFGLNYCLFFKPGTRIMINDTAKINDNFFFTREKPNTAWLKNIMPKNQLSNIDVKSWSWNDFYTKIINHEVGSYHDSYEEVCSYISQGMNS